MKRTIILTATLAVILSCQKQDSIEPQQDSQICFEMGMAATRATSTAFESGDAVALYAVEYASADVAPELQIAGNYINNEELTYDGTAWTGSRSLYWGTAACDFYALYPYAELASVEEHPFEIAQDQNTVETSDALSGYEASDLLWAKAENVEQADGAVSLQFKHMMSKCVVTLTKGEKFEGEIPDDIVAHIYNTTTSAKLNFAKGSVEKDAMGNRKTITMKKLSNERFEAIVVPQNIERRTPLIEVTMGGIAYLLEYSLSFKPGYVHTINLILNTSPDQEKIEISIDAGTGEWN